MESEPGEGWSALFIVCFPAFISAAVVGVTVSLWVLAALPFIIGLCVFSWKMNWRAVERSEGKLYRRWVVTYHGELRETKPGRYPRHPRGA